MILLKEVMPLEGSKVNNPEPRSNPPAIVVVLVKLGMFSPPEIKTSPETENSGVVVL